MGAAPASRIPSIPEDAPLQGHTPEPSFKQTGSSTPDRELTAAEAGGGKAHHAPPGVSGADTETCSSAVDLEAGGSCSGWLSPLRRLRMPRVSLYSEIGTGRRLGLPGQAA
jgi:hypothetical protein